jgi:hypothetical protein
LRRQVGNTWNNLGALVNCLMLDDYDVAPL